MTQITRDEVERLRRELTKAGWHYASETGCDHYEDERATRQRAEALERLVRRALEGPWSMRLDWHAGVLVEECGGCRMARPKRNEEAPFAHAPDCPAVEAGALLKGGA